MIAVLVAGLLSGVPPVVVALMVAATALPVPTAAVVLVLAVRELRRRRLSASSAPEVAALVTVAGELRAGASLRQALAAAVEVLPALAPARRLALAGRDMGEVAAAARPALGRHGDLAASALRLCGRVGGRLAPVFDELAAQVIDADELRRERRAAMAPAVAQGAVVGGIPLLVLAQLAVTGRLAEMAGSGGPGAVLVAVGVLCTLGGVAAIGLVVWRTGRALR